MATDGDIERVRAMADAMAEVARILSDERYLNSVKVFAAKERIRQLQAKLATLRGAA